MLASDCKHRLVGVISRWKVKSAGERPVLKKTGNTAAVQRLLRVSSTASHEVGEEANKLSARPDPRSEHRWYLYDKPAKPHRETRPTLHLFPRLPSHMEKLSNYLKPLHPDSLRQVKHVSLEEAKLRGDSWVGGVLVCVVETEGGKGRSVPNVTEALFGLLRSDTGKEDSQKGLTPPTVTGYPQGRHAHSLGRPEWLIIDAPMHDLLVHVVTPQIEETYAIGQLWEEVAAA